MKSILITMVGREAYYYYCWFPSSKKFDLGSRKKTNKKNRVFVIVGITWLFPLISIQTTVDFVSYVWCRICPILAKSRETAYQLLSSILIDFWNLCLKLRIIVLMSPLSI